MLLYPTECPWVECNNRPHLLPAAAGIVVVAAVAAAVVFACLVHLYTMNYSNLMELAFLMMLFQHFDLRPPYLPYISEPLKMTFDFRSEKINKFKIIIQIKAI